MVVILPKAVIFDWDGTLANTRDAVVNSIEYVLAKYKKEPWNIIKKKYRDKNKSLKDNFINFFGDDFAVAYDDYLRHYQKYGCMEVKVFDGALDVVNFLKNNNILIYIVSNKDNVLLNKEVSNNFKYNVFEKVIGEAKKPNPESVYLALNGADFEINEDNVWFVGDTSQDFDCAKNAGILPILVGSANFMGEDKVDSVLSFDNFNKFLDEIKK